MTKRKATTPARQRGTASVEVVMMLPFFIMVYAGLHYVHGRYLGRELALTRARACAWAYSKAGCDGPEPPECEKPDTGGAALDDPKNNADGGALSVINKIGEIPFIGDLVKAPFDMLFGDPLAIKAYQDVRLPSDPSLGPEVFKVGGAYKGTPHYFTLCNTKRKDWGDVAKDIFCKFTLDQFPGCPRS